jgi:hypothetical protein
LCLSFLVSSCMEKVVKQHDHNEGRMRYTCIFDWFLID